MMRQLHKKPSSHTKVRGFEHLVASAFSLCLLVVLILLPLAPIFAADETVTEVAAEINEEMEVVTDSSENVVKEDVSEPFQNEVDESEAAPDEAQEVPPIETDELSLADETVLIENPALVDDSYGYTVLAENVNTDE